MRTGIRIIVVALVVAVIGAVVPVPADAQGFKTVRPGGRGGDWEFLLPIVYSESVTIDGQGGSSVDLNSDWGMGFGFGYNFTDKFQLNGIFTWASRSYDATIVQTDGTKRRYNNYTDSSTFSLNGVFYFLSGNITPFVSAGVGITYIDTNVQNGTASSSCWYDPWWGYVCSTYVPTKTENDISYNAGLGIRFDVNPQFGIQGGYYKQWIDMSKASGTPDFNTWRFDIIFRM